MTEVLPPSRLPPPTPNEPTLAELSLRIAQVCEPLPGQGPYENTRPIHVQARYCGKSVESFLTERFSHVPARQWQEALERGHILWEGKRRALAHESVRGGTTLMHRLPGTVEPWVSADIVPLYQDPFVLVVHKPAPLPMHPCGRFQRNSLIHLLSLALPSQTLKIVHRLDADTSGVVVLAKTRGAARALVQQFEARTVQKRYRVRVHGDLRAGQRWTRRDPIAKSSAHAGTRDIDPQGRACSTEFVCLGAAGPGQSLLDARPSGGRTHQIRIHAAASGMPVVHDAAYGPTRSLESGLAQSGAASKPLGLHALEITMRHPQDGSIRTWRAPPPLWARFRP